MTFDFTTEMILSHLLPSITINEESDCKDHQIYSKILRKICKKSNLSFIRVIKKFIIWFWSTFCILIYMVQTFLKILWWGFHVARSERLLVSIGTLLCEIWNILFLSMLVCYNTNIFFSEKFAFWCTDALSVQLRF